MDEIVLDEQTQKIFDKHLERHKGIVLRSVEEQGGIKRIVYSPPDKEYDRSTDGWALGEMNHITISIYPDGASQISSRFPPHIVRPEEERERCGDYTYEGNKSWGDHRVTIPGTTCEEVNCHVSHHPTILPGSSEPCEDYYDREGVQPIAAAMWGWDNGGMLREKIGDMAAWEAAHVALDALRDAGYEIVKKQD